MEYTGVGEVYQFNWAIGKELYYQDMFVSGTVYPDMTSEGQEYPETMGYNRDPWVGESHSYGTIKEIKEGYFGGVRPLKYVDLDGIRIIHGIGVTEWKEGECIFGPLKPYNTSYYFRGTPPERHYRSMLVHFERDGEVLYDVWPEKETATAVTYTKGQMATIILPTAPDAGKGKYYRLDKCEDGKIIFEQEKQPQDHIPYIIVPSEDFSIDTSTLDLAGLSPDTVSIAGISFIGSYKSEELKEKEGWYIDIIDTTPDCGFASSGETGKGAFIGALRAYLTVNWDDPINHDGSKGPGDKLEIVLKDNPNSLTPTLSKGEGDEIVNGKWSNGKWFDLQGRKLSGRPARGIYIEDGKKKVMK